MAGSGALGRALIAALDGAGILTANGQLVVSALADLAGQGLLSGNVVAVLNAASDLVGVGDFVGAIGAISDAIAALTGVGTLTSTPRADGALDADITPFTELSPQSLASAVWASTVSGNTTTGSMGELLLDAGGGSSPSVIAAAVWAELLAANQDAGSFGEAVLLLQEELDKRLKTTTFVALK